MPGSKSKSPAFTALVIASALPYPPRAGYELRCWQTIRALAELGRVGVFGLTGGRSEPPPHPAVIAWGVSRDESIAAAPYAASQSLDWLREPGGHPSDRMFSAAAVAEIAELAERLEPAVVVVEGLWLHRYAHSVAEFGAPVVLNAYNVEGGLHAEMAAQRGDPLTRRLAARVRAIEESAFAAVDQLWVCSAGDARLAAAEYGVAAEVVPNTVELERYGPHEPPADGFVALYTGQFGYPPNTAAARRLTDGIFPALAVRVPDARLALVGAEPTAEMRAAAARNRRIEVTGKVDDTTPYFRRASAMPIPLDTGSGTRLKALEAFASELPVVSTAKGVEGLDVVPGRHYLPAETDAEFVDALTNLASDPDLSARVASEASALARKRYSFETAVESIRGALRMLTEG